MNNSIFTIQPYQYNGFWVFDDEKKGIIKEPFVAGADQLLDIIHNVAKASFSLAFSKSFIPKHSYILKNPQSTYGNGTYYDAYITGSKHPLMKIWLCGVLLKYFDERPEQIYVYAQKIKEQDNG